MTPQDTEAEPVFEEDGRSTIFADDPVWIYENDLGWWWRVDYIGGGPFARKDDARNHATDFGFADDPTTIKGTP